MRENVNALIAGLGFVSLEIGLAYTWHWPIAAMVAGVLLLTLGVWPYVRRRAA